MFDEVKTLAVGAKVAVAGRRVGEVSRLRWTEQAYSAADVDQVRRQLGNLPDGVREGAKRLVVEVQFELSDASLRLEPATAQVALLQEGLLGQHFLDLYPGSWAEGDQPSPIFAAGHASPLPIRARRASGLDTLAATVGEAVRSINALTSTLNESVLTGENRENFTILLRHLGNSAADLRRLLAASSADGLQASTIDPLRKMLDAATQAITEVRQRVLDSTLPLAERTLDESRAGLQEFRASLATLRADLTAVLDQLQGTLGDTRPELAESMHRLRGTLWQAELAMRKVRANPSVLLFGSDEPDLEAREFDESGVRATGRARIYRQRDESGSGR
ncbi:MAG TPA: MlaD family protein [Planctomycetota bacterium]